MINEKSRPPAFQFYCRDWLSSATIPAMTDKEFRAYVNLLAHAWLSDPVGSLPNDDKALAAMSGIGRQGWKNAAKMVRSCFEVRGARLHNVKLETQFERLAQFTNVKTKSGKMGAAKRWKRSDNQSMDDGTAIDSPMANGMAKNSSASAFASASAKQPPYPPSGGTDFVDPKGERRRPLTRLSPGVRRGTGGWYHDAGIVECDTCGPTPDFEHLKCHYCFKVYDRTKGETDDKHVCRPQDS